MCKLSDQESLEEWLKQNRGRAEKESFEFIFKFCFYICFTDHKNSTQTSFIDSGVTYWVPDIRQAPRKQDKDGLCPQGFQVNIRAWYKGMLVVVGRKCITIMWQMH